MFGAKNGEYCLSPLQGVCLNAGTLVTDAVVIIRI